MNEKLAEIFFLAKRLPYRKWWFWLLAIVLLRSAYVTIDNSRPVIYDPQALGFTGESEMLSAFAKGYHTRQKMEEMARFYAEGQSPQPANANQ